jgi:large repetitive protein
MQKVNALNFLVIFMALLCLSANVLVVSGETTIPVPNATVSASGLNTSSSGTATSDPTGKYNITSWLDTDNYTLTASATGYITTTVSNVTVTSASETANINLQMSISGVISGKVTDAISSAGLFTIVIAKNATSGSFVASAFTDSSGNYQIVSNLATGTYNVSVISLAGYLDKTIGPVSVTAGSITANQNLAMSRSGAISGTVTDSVTNAIQTSVLVEAIDSTGSTVAITTTNSTGMYLLNTNLITGTYNVTILFPTNHLSKTVSGISVTTGSQTITNIAINPSGIISGKVTVSGQGITGASVSAYSSDFVYFGSATTDANGNYQITSGLGTSTYTISVSYPQSTGGIVTAVSVTAGLTTSNVNVGITVLPTGAISGKVTSSVGGAGLANVYVQATSFSGSNSNYTDSLGNYIISNLLSGVYNVTASRTGYTTVSQTSVIVTPNTVTSGINLQLTPRVSGRISGLVQSQGTPIPESPTITAVFIIVLSIAAIIIASPVNKKIFKMRVSPRQTG